MQNPDETLNTGEKAIDNAPRLTLRNGRSCIPQHYLQYAHSLASVEALITDIDFCTRYPIFVSEDDGNIILQIGIIGQDNYRSSKRSSSPKIVFGRKWRIEPNLPSSEVIQTAFLAIKKAREHEIRELFTLRLEEKTTTPFNNHHDLPLMARNSDILTKPALNTNAINIALDSVSFDGGVFNILDIQTLRNGFTAITLSYAAKTSDHHEEFTEEPIIILLKTVTPNALYHALMSEMIAISDRLVDETFTYRGFARFSRQNEVTAIAQLSADLRQNPKAMLESSHRADRFVKNFAAERYDTDLSRIPQLTQSAYGQKLYKRLSSMHLSNFDMLLKAQDKT